MNETKTKQSVTQQKSNWKPWQIVLVILLGLCALPVVVPVGLGLSNPGHSIADRTGVADLERNFMDPQQGWRKEKSRQRRAGT